ncbi:hypothetical protein ABPG74_014146 [Tetrahymena malaccensis]
MICCSKGEANDTKYGKLPSLPPNRTQTQVANLMLIFENIQRQKASQISSSELERCCIQQLEKYLNQRVNQGQQMNYIICQLLKTIIYKLRKQIKQINKKSNSLRVQRLKIFNQTEHTLIVRNPLLPYISLIYYQYCTQWQSLKFDSMDIN